MPILCETCPTCGTTAVRCGRRHVSAVYPARQSCSPTWVAVMLLTSAACGPTPAGCDRWRADAPPTRRRDWRDPLPPPARSQLRWWFCSRCRDPPRDAPPDSDSCRFCLAYASNPSLTQLCNYGKYSVQGVIHRGDKLQIQTPNTATKSIVKKLRGFLRGSRDMRFQLKSH